MIYKYSNLFFPICSCVISVFIFLIYNSKEKIKTVETKIYSKIMIVTLIESISTFLLTLFVHLFFINGYQLFFRIFNKALYCVYLTWISLIFKYFLNISALSEKKIKRIEKISLIVNIIGYIVIFILPVKLIYLEKELVSNSYGPSANALFVGCGLYILGMFFIIKYVFMTENSKKKLIPFFNLIFLMTIAMIIRLIDPYCNLLSNVVSFICLVMYFTIENPDVKMIAQLESAKDMADKANRAKSDFLSSMSHEIRTPLNAIVGLSEDICTYQDQLPPEVVEDSNDIMNASHTLLEIVGNILDINKIESDKMEIIESKYNFKEEIEGMVRVTITRIGEKNINFHLNIAEDIPYELIGDKGKVKEIINNLLTNSIKYTDEGEINLTIKCINDSQNQKTTLMITCQDTGKGIKEEMINRLFNKFDRLDVERNTTTEGTGLGLAITKALIEMMGGNINVQSQYGVGSIFMVNLPQKIAEIEMPLTNTQALNLRLVQETLEDSLKGKKVLIVDDNKLNIKVARKAIASFEFDIDECYDGVECLDKIIAGNTYDLILMDIMMPNMSGETCIEKLKQMPNFNTPCIALTADAVAGAKERYLGEGFIDYIQKPFSRDQIKEKLDQIFKK